MNFIKQNNGIGHFRIFHCNFECNWQSCTKLICTSTIMLINVQTRKFTVCKFASFQRLLKKMNKPLNSTTIFEIKYQKTYSITIVNNFLYQYIIDPQIITNSKINMHEFKITVSIIMEPKTFFLITKIVQVFHNQSHVYLLCKLYNSFHKICYYENCDNLTLKEITQIFKKFANKYILFINVDYFKLQANKTLIINKHSIFTLLNNNITAFTCNMLENKFILLSK